MTRTAAVTGATGFVGGAVARRLLAEGWRVLGYGRRSLDMDGVQYTRWDLAEAVISVDEPVDVVVHCAAAVTDWGVYDAFYVANVRGTVHVLRTFREAGQFIHISTASVYDPAQAKDFITEDAPYGDRYLNAYSQTKAMAERAVLHAENANRAILRPHVVYGPGDTLLLPRLLRAKRGGRLLAVGDGQNPLSLTYIDNLVDAVLLAIEYPTDGEIFNVTDATTPTLDEVLWAFIDAMGLDAEPAYIPLRVARPAAAMLERIYRLLRTPSAPLLTPYIVHQLASEYTLSIEKARRVLGYDPQTDYRDGFTAAAAWWHSR